jgi:hypothetical protein
MLRTVESEPLIFDIVICEGGFLFIPHSQLPTGVVSHRRMSVDLPVPGTPITATTIIYNQF